MHLIMFDLDGTLIKSDTLDTRCLTSAIEKVMGIDDFERDWAKYNYVTDAGIASEVIDRHLNRKVSHGELCQISDKLLEFLQVEAGTNREKFAPLPGALDLIHGLKADNNCGFAIATGCWEKSARFKLATAEFEVSNFPLASSDDSYHREEIMRIAFERALDFYNVSAFETVTYVGDGIWDLKASLKLGYGFIGIESNNQGGQLQQEGASYILNDFSDQSCFFNMMNQIWTG
jgi:phosphoglycolate phosphatase-like HAD superfamily hydrolase